MVTTKSIYKSTAGQAEILALYNQVLSRWPVPCEHINVSTRYGDTFVLASGVLSAPSLVLLHGTGSNSATWAHDVIKYSQHYRVYAVDIPGEPGKSDPNRFTWDGPAFADWLDDVLNGLNVARVSLGGMSLGAWATIKYTLYKPEQVEKVVLICPSGIYPPRLSFTLKMMGFSLLGEWGLNRMKRLIFQNTPLSDEADLFFTLVGKHFKFRVGSPPLFTDEELQSLTMPILFLAGEKDVLLNSQKSAERLQRLVPDLTTNLLKEDGHAAINLAARVMPFLTDEVYV
jgi:pimeloyl-ACP methyl ester carboxylesterase